MNAATPVVLADRISRRFDAGLVLHQISFAVQPGERVALLGPNGAGKTTLLRLLTSLARPSGGRLRLFGLDPAQAGSQVRARIGVVGHQSLLSPELTAAENLRYYAGLYSLPEPAARVTQLLEQVGLAPRANERVQRFSRGMQQRLALARALLHDPELLLLDEPDAGLDVRALDLLPAAFARTERGPARTVIFTTHQVDRALDLARRALVLVAGRLVYDGPAGALDGARLAALYGGAAGGS